MSVFNWITFGGILRMTLLKVLKLTVLMFSVRFSLEWICLVEPVNFLILKMPSSH